MNVFIMLTSVVACIFGLFSLINGEFAANAMKNFCYFTNWSPSLSNFDARFDVRDINATLCSHLIYAFANIDPLELKLIKSDAGDDNGSLTNKLGRYFEFNKLKIKHPELVTLLSIGGANGKGFYQIVANEASMTTFARNVAIYLRDRDFDGIDIDWEWPMELYRNRFTMLLEAFRQEFDAESLRENKPKLLITIAVAVGEDTISKSFDIPQISRLVDFIQVMAYDFHGTWSRVTSFSAPLNSRQSDIRFNQQLSQVQFAHSRQLAGIMFWSLEADDFMGKYCNDGKFPLLTSIYNTIQELAATSGTNITIRSKPSTQSTTPVEKMSTTEATLTESDSRRAITRPHTPGVTETPTANAMKNFCYFTNWSPSLANFDARFDVRDINATLCSHLIYAFAYIDPLELKLIKSDAGDDNGSLTNKLGRYFEFNKLKITHPELVTLLSIGGANGKGFYQIVANEASMTTFARNVAIYLRDRDFDGIDIDWEWPMELYRNRFTMLLEAFRQEFDAESLRESKPKLLITIAVAVGEDTISKSYDIPQISRLVDFIQVMAYDFHGTWSRVTSFSAPLNSRQSDIRFNQQLSQQWAIDRWISGGASRDKLMMGITGMATTFTLENVTNAGVGAPVKGPGKVGPYYGIEGHATYYRVCEMIKKGAVYKVDHEQNMAYAVLEDQWVGYGNPDSMKAKVQFAHSRQLARIMFWSLEADDFMGKYCNDGKFPLLTSIYNTIQELAATSGTNVTIRSKPSTQSTTPVEKSGCSFMGGTGRGSLYMTMILTGFLNYMRVKFV